MGSDLYSVSVLSVKQTRASLLVKVIHPDSMSIPADPSFAMMLIHHHDSAEAPLMREVSFDDTLDTAWMKSYGKGFIRGVKVSRITGAPPRAARQNSNHAYWENSGKWMSGQIDITVSDPAWISHLEGSWASRAFQLISDYDDHAPITVGDRTSELAPDPDPDAGFVWVPREVFAEAPHYDEMPPLLQIPAYADSAYMTKERLPKAKATTKQLGKWLGRAVVIKDSFSIQTGALTHVVGPGSIQLTSYRVGSRGHHRAKLEWIAEPVLGSGRRGSKVDYDTIIKDTRIVSAGGKISGTKLELVLRLPPGTREVHFESESDALGVLVAALLEGRHGEIGKSKLTTALLADLAANELEGNHRLGELIPWVAKKYIASWKLVMPRSKKVTLDDKTAKAILGAPWPTATLHVTVTDKKWLEHFDPKARHILPEWALPKPSKPPKQEPAPVHRASDARVVLYTDTMVWIAERTGATWKTKTGKRRYNNTRKENTFKATDAVAAQASLDKAVKTKIKDGYRRAPGRDEARATVWKRMGLELEDASGILTVTKVAPKSSKLKVINTVWYKPNDQIHQIDNRCVCTVEEVVTLIEGVAKGAGVYCDSYRPASSICTNVDVRMLT